MKMVMFLVIIFLLIGSLMIMGARDISLANSTGRKTFFFSEITKHRFQSLF